MEKYKSKVNYILLALKYEMTNPTTYIFLTFIFCLSWYCFSGVADWLSSHSDCLNIFELYIFFGTGFFTQTIYLIGIVFFSCRSFYFSQGSMYYLIRGNKKNWCTSQIFYASGIVLMFNIFLIIIFAIACKGQIVFDGSWSNTSFLGVMRGPLEIGVSGVISMAGQQGLLEYNPNFIGFLSFILLNLEGIFVSILIILFTIKNKTGYGVAIIFGGYFVDFLITVEIGTGGVFKFWNYIMPLHMYQIANSSLNNGGISIIYILVFTFIITVIMIMLLNRLVVHTDYMKLE